MIKSSPSGLSSTSRVNAFVPWMVFLLACGTRLIPFAHVFDSGKVYLYDPDCYIRLRKIFIYLRAFPAPVVYDYFEGFPRGTGIISPPTMEYLVAAAAYPFRNVAGLAHVLETFVAFAPVLTGGLTVVMMWRWIGRLFGGFAAVTASIVLALYPPFIDATVLGRFDNEMLEPLLLLATFWIYSGTYEDERVSTRWSAVGLMHFLYLAVWRGAIFPLSIIGFDLLVRIIVNRGDEKRAAELGKAAALMYVTAAVPVAIICITDIWWTRHAFSFNIISWFHVALFMSAAAFMPLLSFAVARRWAVMAKKSAILYSGLAIAVCVMVIILARNAAQGLKIVGGGNSWIDSINQYQRGMSNGNFLFLYGGISLLAPFALVLRRALVDRIKWRRFLIIWTLFMAAGALARVRFSEYYGLNVAILSGVAVSYAAEKAAGVGRLFRKMAPAAAMAVLLVLQSPTFYYLSSLYHSGPSFSIKGDIEDTMLWLRQNTPFAGYPYRPSILPRYGILARWDYGGWIESIAERPSVATSFGTETYGVEEIADFFLSSEETEMEAVLRRNNVRYIIIDKVIGDLPMYARLVGRADSFYAEQWDPKLKTSIYLPNKEVFSLISSRLFFADGSMVRHGDISFAPVEGVRLVYESPSPAKVFNFPWEIKKMKVFEYIEGVTAIIKGVPGEVVTLSQRIMTNQGRCFTYVNRKAFEKDGTARFKLLYTQKAYPFKTGAIEPATIMSNGKKREISITDSDVQAQKIVRVSF